MSAAAAKRAAKAPSDRSPAITFLPYQKRWLQDRAPLKVWNKSRQIGGSFAVGFEVADHALTTGQDWLVMSRTWPQTLELLETVKKHLKAFNTAYDDLEGDEIWDEDQKKPVKVRVVHLASAAGRKARIIASPSNPDSARSWAGNRVLDESAFHRDQDETWKASYGSVLRGFLMRVISTPNGRANRFYRLCTEEANGFSKHRTTLEDAIREGLCRNDGSPIDVEEIRRGCGDEETFLQEFCCEFVDGALSWLGFDLIASVESRQATLAVPEKWIPQGSLFGGMDVARRAHNTVIWIWERLGDVLWTRAIEVFRNKSFAEQEHEAEKWLQRKKLRRFAIDATGMGGPSAERLRKKYGSRVEEVTFTQDRKEEMADLIRDRFEAKTARIPIDQDLRADLGSIKRFLGATGKPRFDAVASEALGHGDRFWAGAMGIAAADSGHGDVGMAFG